jgi:hypothetical protein
MREALKRLKASYQLLTRPNDPLPALEGQGFTMRVSIVTPSITGLLNTITRLGFIKCLAPYPT